ncbi:MAG TPA: DcrB-related protein, partial [Pyrinomonadaceae bacterium]|nr:DcrB-related protein [Pyrinomonadaceae bacterium]
MREFVYNDFVIGMPDRWTDESVVMLCAPPRGDHSPSITVTRERAEAGSDAAAYAAEQLSMLRREIADADYRVLEESSLPLGDSVAFLRIHTFLVVTPDGVETRVTQMQVYAVGDDDEAVTVTCTD